MYILHYYCVISLTHEKLLVLIFLAIPYFIIVFGVLISYYDKTTYKKRHNAFLKELNEDELLRIKCNLSKFDNGHIFIDHQHPSTSDLNRFSQHSLFQLINRATTETGGNVIGMAKNQLPTM